MAKKFYNEIRFALAENLREDLKQILVDRGLEATGLVALKISVNSLPEIEVVPVEGSPTDFIKKLGEEDGITQEVLNKKLKEAFGEQII